ncbi:MAG: hypothetical protein U0271_48705 [Polyangiaceae bacterium]
MGDDVVTVAVLDVRLEHELGGLLEVDGLAMRDPLLALVGVA